MTLDDFLSRFQLLQPEPAPPAIRQREAAVLVPVVRRTQPGLLLTHRSLSLRKHAGEVAFPGGSRDASDTSLIMTALRETEEEIGIPPDAVEIVGRLPCINSATGFRVTPVVGLIAASQPVKASQDEVATIFEMPLAQALATDRYYPLDIERQRVSRRVWLSWYEEHFVWGMTASIIRALALQIRGGSGSDSQ